MYQDRIPLYKKLEYQFDSNVLVYVTSDRVNMGAQIAPDVIDYFIGHLDKIGTCQRLTLYLYTRGGDVAAAWNIVNLLRMFCEELQVIVPHKAHSSGTIICLGANEIIMTKQATLGPIDPSINTPLNPSIKDRFGNINNIPVSVEAVKGYMAFAKEEAHIEDDVAMANVLIKLCDYVHPLVLGEVYRSQAQIKMLAEKLLINQMQDQEKIQKIISFLCSDSGGHDYTINRREAKGDLGLNVVNPSEEQYGIIKAIYEDIQDELQFTTPFQPNTIQGAYAVRRCILESLHGGADYLITEGIIRHISNNDKQIIGNEIKFEGWRHEDCSVERFSIEDSVEGISYEQCDELQV